MPEFQEKFKAAVQRNFDLSVDNYNELEKKHAYFAGLCDRLLGHMSIPEAENGKALDILDVGCGTGSSVGQIAKISMNAKICGIDISEKMLNEAQRRYAGTGAEFICGDGERLTEYFPPEKFDVIIYPASLFLMPDQEKSLSEAKAILKPGGYIAASILMGLKEKTGQPLESLSETKGIIKNDSLQSLFETHFSEVRSAVITAELDNVLAADIYKIEALSAGLFPGKPYPERMERVQAIISEAKEKNLRLAQEWLLISAKKH